MLQGRLGLDEILRRDISTDWYEGVAVIQAVCRNTPGVNVPGTGFPAPGQISVASTGEIELLGIASGNGVVAAGRLLGEMLHNDVPVRLRLIHSEAVAPNPAFGTLQELVEALAYFERPDGQQTIQKLYARAIAAAERQGHTDHSTAQPVAPPQTAGAAEFKPESHEPQAEPPRKRQSNPLYAVAAGIVLVAVASTAFMSYSGEPGGSVMSGVDEPVERPEAKATTKPAAKAAAGSRSTKKGEATTSTPRVGERTQPTQRLAGSRPASLPRLNTLMMSDLVSLTPPPIAVPRFPAAHIFHELIEVPAAPGPERDHDGVPVYSRLNGEVRPPIAIRPHLPSEPPAYIPVEHLMVLDLVVTNKGLVESVRLLTDPRTVNDFMIVSAAKAWIFAPATLNGQPVKYRHRIRFAVP
jgi:hypothetical protein